MLQWSSPPVTALGPSWAAWVSAGYHRDCACGLASCRAPARLGCAVEGVHRGTQVGLLGQVRGVIEHIEKRMKELQAEKQELAEFQELDKVRNCLLTLWPIRSAIPAHKSTLHPQASQAQASSRPFIGSFRCAVVHWTRHGRAGPGWAGPGICMCVAHKCAVGATLPRVHDH